MILSPEKNKFFTAQEIKPAGWLRQQLKIQADGLSGNLDKIWPDVSESKWIGGSREGWERVPYWLDGFIPLAWLLEDADLQARATRYVDAILANQQEDGWICPCTNEERAQYDMWALFLIGKVLVVYYDCTNDPRIEDAIYRALKNLDKHMDHHTLFGWASARWYECLIPLFWLYDRKPEEWMLDLCANLGIHGFDFNALFDRWRMSKPEKRWNFTSHVVNIAMSLKSQALYSRYTGEDSGKMAEQAFELLMRDHGMACGHFTGDECLAGTSPIHGSELCSVVEAMYSYEWLYALTGNPMWADRLEALAYNALPATMSPDMWTHQYDQMSNQVQCSRIPDEYNPFFTNSGESHLFGLEPNFGCCTANFSQGWPKFALSTFYRTEKGIAIGAIAPSTLTCEINGIDVQCEIITNYPFADGYTVKVKTGKSVHFDLDIRIPALAINAEIGGEAATAGSIRTVSREWNGDCEIKISFDFKPEYVQRERGLSCVKRGPLVYSLPIEEDWAAQEYERDGVPRKAPYCDYEIFPKSKWNYAYTGGALEFISGEVGEIPFSPKGAPVSITTMAMPVEWEFSNGLCAEKPASAEPSGEAEPVKLIPYGCTNLRMTELPVCR